jgi:predicted RNA-binding Zn-ribbon protein involved in translation (DUF1610 family)
MTAGTYRGKHYTEWTDTVRSLKRDGKDEEAITLLTGLVGAVERESRSTGHSLAPWYTEHLAMLHRARKDYAAEIAVLDRFAKANAAHGGLVPKLAARHRKATDLLAAAQDADAPAACPACGTVLDGTLGKAFACPHCAEPLLARRRHGTTVLLRAADKSADTLAQDAARHRETMLRQANTVGASDADFEKAERALSARFGAPADPADVFWSLANQIAVDAAAQGRWPVTATAYRTMAQHLVSEGRGWVEVQRQAVLAEMRAMTWVADSEPLTVTGCDCTPCASATPSVVTRVQALTSGPPPHADCARPPCRCWLAQDRSSLTREITVTVEVDPAPSTPERGQRSEAPGLLRRLFRNR